MNGNETSMGPSRHANEPETFVGTNGTGMQADLSSLFRLEKRTIIRKTAMQALMNMVMLI